MTTKYTITYNLTPEQYDRIKVIADENGRSVKEEFRYMMQTGSTHDIGNKLKIYERWHENGKHNRGIA